MGTTAGGVGRKRGDVRAFRACYGLDFCSGRGWTLFGGADTGGGQGDDRGAPRVGRVTHWKVCTKAGDAVAWAVAASFGSVCILGAF